MELFLNTSIYNEMIAAANETMPAEACGICAGEDNRIIRFYKMTNADASAEHFSMFPQEQFAVMKRIRQEGLKMLAIWHSHPTTPARMSQEDIRFAYTPDVVYLILSLAIPKQPIMRGFKVCGNKVVQVKICIE